MCCVQLVLSYKRKPHYLELLINYYKYKILIHLQTFRTRIFIFCLLKYSDRSYMFNVLLIHVCSDCVRVIYHRVNN